ncbi:hypothetical protein BH10PLA2_BH10PLA2_05490 [soil metagenome]
MAMTFDATLKDMVRESPEGFLAAFDRATREPVRLLNVDLSTVTRAADLVLGLGEPLTEIIHLDFQVSAAAWKHADLLAYNALLFAHYHLPVHTILVLLRPQAAHGNQTGKIEFAPRPGRGSMKFEYEIIRLWDRPAEEFLRGELGTIPLAVLGRFSSGASVEDGLAQVARLMAERLAKEASKDRAIKLLTEAYLLAGLRLRRKTAANIFRGVRVMEESDTYLAILDEGRERHAKHVLRMQGKRRFGPADSAIDAAIQVATDLDRLDRMLERIFDATSWQDLLDTP